MATQSVADVIALAVVCGLSLLIAGVTRYRPPRQINWLYGYRTARAMRSPAAWHEANGYFARYFWRLSWLLPLVAVGATLLLDSQRALLVLLVFWLAGIGFGLVRTERRLKRLFG